MVERKKPAPRKRETVSRIAEAKPAETFMQVERWTGKTWRGQKFYLRVTDTRNGEKLLVAEPYADQRDRDKLFDRFAAMGMRPLDIP